MKSHHLPLIIGISLPIVFIIIISLVIFVPVAFIKPTHNFVYIAENPNYYGYETYTQEYVVDNNKVITKPIVRPVPQYPNQEPQAPRPDKAPDLYLYDVQNNTSRKITLSEAQELTIVAGPSSPDGYAVEYVYGHSGIFELFGSSGDERGYFITKGNVKKRLNGITNGQFNYSNGFNLIGWVK